VRDQVSHPHKTTGKTTVFCTLIFGLLDSMQEKWYQVGTLTRESPSAGSGDPDLCELQVPLALWVAPGKGSLLGLCDGQTGLVSQVRQTV
jgi:hypothetical protein